MHGLHGAQRVPDNAVAEKQWAHVEQALEQIYNRNTTQCSFQFLYGITFKLVTYHGSFMYDRFCQLVKNRVLDQKGRLDDALLHKRSHGLTTFHVFLAALAAEWSTHVLTTTLTSHLLIPLDKQYCTPQRVLSVDAVATRLFGELIMGDTAIRRALQEGVLQQIDRSRNGEDAPAMHELLPLSRMCAAIDRRLLFEETIETPFLDATESFYNSESAVLIATVSLPEFIESFFARLNQERHRTGACFGADTVPKVETVLSEAWINDHITALIDKETTGVAQLFLAQRFAELHRVYSAFCFARSGVKVINALAHTIATDGAKQLAAEHGLPSFTPLIASAVWTASPSSPKSGGTQQAQAARAQSAATLGAHQGGPTSGATPGDQAESRRLSNTSDGVAHHDFSTSCIGGGAAGGIGVEATSPHRFLSANGASNANTELTIAVVEYLIDLRNKVKVLIEHTLTVQDTSSSATMPQATSSSSGAPTTSAGPPGQGQGAQTHAAGQVLDNAGMQRMPTPPAAQPGSAYPRMSTWSPGPAPVPGSGPGPNQSGAHQFTGVQGGGGSHGGGVTTFGMDFRAGGRTNVAAPPALQTQGVGVNSPPNVAGAGHGAGGMGHPGTYRGHVGDSGNDGSGSGAPGTATGTVSTSTLRLPRPGQIDRAVKLALSKAFEQVVNSCEDAAAHLARYLDLALRHNISEDDLDVLSEGIIEVFSSLREKDIFEDSYRTLLARRLLTLPKQSLHEEKELVFIRQLKRECGAATAQRLEKMLQDRRVSEGLDDAFRQSSECAKIHANYAATSISVFVVSTGLWPVMALPPALALPPPMKAVSDAFTAFYVAQHNGRRLTFSTGQGSVDLRMLVPSSSSSSSSTTHPSSTGASGQVKRYEVNLPTAAVSVLLLFDKQLTSTSSSAGGAGPSGHAGLETEDPKEVCLTLEQIADHLSLPLHDTTRAAVALTRHCAQHAALLVAAAPSSTPDNHSTPPPATAAAATASGSNAALAGAATTSSPSNRTGVATAGVSSGRQAQAQITATTVLQFNARFRAKTSKVRVAAAVLKADVGGAGGSLAGTSGAFASSGAGAAAASAHDGGGGSGGAAGKLGAGRVAGGSTDDNGAGGAGFGADGGESSGPLAAQVASSHDVERMASAASRQRVGEDRKHQIDAAIVRVMKSRRQLEHRQLVGETVTVLKRTFVPAPDDIKRRVEVLIEREYLERAPENPGVYRYLA